MPGNLFELLENFLRVTDAPQSWKILTRMTRLNFRIIPMDDNTKLEDGLYENGTLLKRCDDGSIEWTEYTVEDHRLQHNHYCVISTNGLIKPGGYVNIFVLGRMRIDRDYIESYMEGAMCKAMDLKEAGKPYWDNVITEDGGKVTSQT